MFGFISYVHHGFYEFGTVLILIKISGFHRIFMIKFKLLNGFS
jgi:hypothetical protein